MRNLAINCMILPLCIYFLSGCEMIQPKPMEEDKPTVLEYTRDADTAYDQGDWATALSLYQKGTDADPNLEYLWFRIGNCHAKLGNFNNAVFAYIKVLKIQPNNIKAHHNLASAHMLAAKQSLIALKSRITKNGTVRDKQLLKVRLHYLEEALALPLQDMAGFASGVSGYDSNYDSLNNEK